MYVSIHVLYLRVISSHEYFYQRGSENRTPPRGRSCSGWCGCIYIYIAYTLLYRIYVLDIYVRGETPRRPRVATGGWRTHARALGFGQIDRLESGLSSHTHTHTQSRGLLFNPLLSNCYTAGRAEVYLVPINPRPPPTPQNGIPVSCGPADRGQLNNQNSFTRHRLRTLPAAQAQHTDGRCGTRECFHHII